MVSVDQVYMIGHMKNADGSINNKNVVLSAENISDTVAERKLFPCFFGSALKQWGITELLDGLNAYLPQQESDCRI